jgi:hypothetical protein
VQFSFQLAFSTASTYGSNSMTQINKKLPRYYFFIIFIISANVYGQGQFASETDLRAGYCLSTIKAGSGAIPESSEKLDPLIIEFSNQMNAKFSSLQRYLRTRSQSMNPNAVRELSAAISAGEEAHKRSKITNDACFKEILPNNSRVTNTTVKEMEDCRIRKQGETEIRRIENCISLDFLPY